MKNTSRAMRPYIIINALLWGILGAFIGKNLVEIHNTRKRINNDSEALKRYIKDLGGSATHIKIEDIDEDEVPEDIRKKADPRDPMDPTVIYVYD